MVDIMSEIVLTAEPHTSRVVAYWEDGTLISTAVETDSDVYMLEVRLKICVVLQIDYMTDINQYVVVYLL